MTGPSVNCTCCLVGYLGRACLSSSSNIANYRFNRPMNGPKPLAGLRDGCVMFVQRAHKQNLSHDRKSLALRVLNSSVCSLSHSGSLHLSLPCKSWMNWIISDLKFGFKIVYFGSCPWRRGPVIECFRFHWLDRPGFKVGEQVLRLMLLQLAYFIGISRFYYETAAWCSAPRLMMTLFLSECSLSMFCLLLFDLLNKSYFYNHIN